MENNKILVEIKFALENGHKEVKMGYEKDGSFFIIGAFGYIATDDKELEKEIKSLFEEKEEINLTKKEENVLGALIECTYEMGLPVEVQEIKDITKMSKKSIVGVVSSLYKKGLVESYDINEEEEFILTEKGVNAFN